MKTTFLLFCLCLGLGAPLAHAGPIPEDEPLPFDTHMPPMRAEPAPVPAAQRADAKPRAAERRADGRDDARGAKPSRDCRTVVRKVKGRKVRKEVCSAGAAETKSGRSSARSGAKSGKRGRDDAKASAKRTRSAGAARKPAAKNQAVKSRKRRS